MRAYQKNRPGNERPTGVTDFEAPPLIASLSRSFATVEIIFDVELHGDRHCLEDRRTGDLEVSRSLSGCQIKSIGVFVDARAVDIKMPVRAAGSKRSHVHLALLHKAGTQCSDTTFCIHVTQPADWSAPPREKGSNLCVIVGPNALTRKLGCPAEVAATRRDANGLSPVRTTGPAKLFL